MSSTSHEWNKVHRKQVHDGFQCVQPPSPLHLQRPGSRAISPHSCELFGVTIYPTIDYAQLLPHTRKYLIPNPVCISSFASGPAVYARTSNHLICSSHSFSIKGSGPYGVFFFVILRLHHHRGRHQLRGLCWFRRNSQVSAAEASLLFRNYLHLIVLLWSRELSIIQLPCVESTKISLNAIRSQQLAMRAGSERSVVTEQDLVSTHSRRDNAILHSISYISLIGVSSRPC